MNSLNFTNFLLKKFLLKSEKDWQYVETLCYKDSFIFCFHVEKIIEKHKKHKKLSYFHHYAYSPLKISFELNDLLFYININKKDILSP